GAGWLSLGSEADPPVAREVRPRRGVRGGGRDREPRHGGAVRGAWRPAPSSFLAVRAGRGGRRLLAERRGSSTEHQADSAPPTRLRGCGGGWRGRGRGQLGGAEESREGRARLGAGRRAQEPAGPGA